MNKWQISINLLMILILTTVIIGCNSNTVYRQFTKIPGVIWKKTDKVLYKVTIDEPVNNAAVYLAMRVDDAIQEQYVDVLVSRTTPKGQQQSAKHRMQIKNAKGMHLGDGAANLWDVEQMIEGDIGFNQVGTYTYEVKNLMPKDVVLLVDIGLIIKKKNDENNDKVEH